MGWFCFVFIFGLRLRKETRRCFKMWGWRMNEIILFLEIVFGIPLVFGLGCVLAIKITKWLGEKENE